MKNKLSLAANQKVLGTLEFDSREDTFDLTYDKDWMSEGFPLSPHLPLNATASSITIKRFLENLFPEGKNLELLLEEYRIGRGHTFRLLQILGNETTGALQFLPETRYTQNTSFRKVSEEELIERLNKKNKESIAIWDGKPRLSVAGVQDKLPMTILSSGEMGFGEGDLASTHILKFQKEDPDSPSLVLNEYFCMKLAERIKLPVADVTYKRLGKHPVLFVKRFDRQLISDENVLRFHVIDGCQALDLPSTHKYERNYGSGRDVAHIRDGANMKMLLEFTSHCETPAAAILTTLQWVLFNLCISNADAHAKNISYFIDRKGIRITPFYDLVNVSMYPKFEQELAMSIGDEFKSEEIFAFQLAEFCRDLGLNKRILVQQLKKIATKIIDELDQISLPVLTEEENSFIARLKESIRARGNHFLTCSKEVSKL